MEYYATSQTNFHMVDKYIKNISWYGMEYFLKFFLVHLNKFAYSSIGLLKLLVVI
jgi:hypothetical protein